MDVYKTLPTDTAVPAHSGRPSETTSRTVSHLILATSTPEIGCCHPLVEMWIEKYKKVVLLDT